MKKCRFPLGLVLGLLGVSSPVFATTYYVNSNATYGNDTTHSGTSPGSAWQTLHKVSQQTFSPGDIVAFRRGQSWSGEVGQNACVLQLNGSGTDSSHVIRATSYDSDSGTGGVIGDGGSGALPIFYGIPGSGPSPANGEYTVLLMNQQYWTVEDLDIRGGQYAAVMLKATTANTVYSGITLRNLNIENTDYYTPSGWHGTGLEIYAAGASQGKFDTIHVTGCTIANTWDRGMYVTSTQVLTNNPTTNSAYYITGLQITNNTVTTTRTDGISVNGCEDILVSGNTVSYAGNYQPTDTTKPNFNGIFWGSCLGSASVGCQVEYNTVSHTAKHPKTDTNGYFTDNMAFDLDLGNAGLHLLQYNLTDHNAGGFCEVLKTSLNDVISGVTDRFIARLNLSHHDDLNALASNPAYCSLIKGIGRHQEFYRNTFYCGTGPAIVSRDIDTGEEPLEDGTLVDNIFYDPAGFYSGKIHGNVYQGNSTNPFNYDHNCFSVAPVGVSPDTNSVVADPVFRNASSPTVATDLQLMTTTPCWNAGTNTGVPNPTPQLDYFAFAYDQGLTMGADVFEDTMRFRLENNLTDNSGHGYNGTYSSGSPTFLTGGQQHSGNYCLGLTGTGYVSAGIPTFGAELGIDLWVYPTTSSGYRRLVDKCTVGGQDGFVLDLNPSNDVRFIVGYSEVLSSTALVLNTWSHVEATYAQNGTIAVYINGTQVASATVGNTPVPNNGSLQVRLGADQNGTSLFSGRLDDVKVRKDSTLR